MIYFVLINYDLIVRLYSNSFCNIFLSNGGWLAACFMGMPFRACFYQS